MTSIPDLGPVTDLLVYLTIPLAVLGIFVYRMGRVRGLLSWRELLVYPLVIIALESAFLGLGFTWNLWSKVGKVLSLSIVASLPFVVAQLSAHAALRRGRSRREVLLAAGFGGVAAMAVAFPGMHLILDCLLTSDCV